jgi:hypothetical protein
VIKMKIQICVVIGALLICCCAGSEIIGQTPGNERNAKSPTPSSADFTWRGKVEAGGTLEIIGVSGDIQAEVYEGDEVEVVAIKQGNKNGFDQVQIRVEESAGRVRICAAYPLLNEQGRSECMAGKKRRDVATIDDREVYVRSEEGEKQSFRLEGVRVQFRVRIPSRKSFGAQVRLETRDVIATDFPITALGRFSGNGLEGVIGQGGLKLTLHTIFGNVELRRAQ